MRLPRVLAAAGVLMLGAVAAGCGEDDSTSLPEASDSSSAPSVAEQEKAALAAVKNYEKTRIEFTQTGDDGPFSETATAENADEVIAGHQREYLDKNRMFLGQYSYSNPEVSVSDGTATVDVCLDGHLVFVVPKGAESAGPGMTSMPILRHTYTVIDEDGTWKVSDISEKVTEC